MATIFSRIIAGELPGTFVYADELCVALMDINPQVRGHLMVIPRQEIDHWIDLPDDLRNHLFAVAQKIGSVLPQTFESQRCGLVIAGYGVPHTHLHVLPIDSGEDLNPANATPLDPTLIAADAAAIRSALRDADINGVFGD